MDTLDRPAALTCMRAHLQALASDVDATRRDAGFQNALEGLALFWNYSPFNQWLIREQRPDATQVAGAATWRALGRKPRPGETPISLFAYSGTRRPPFVRVSAWDVKQTRGRRITSLDVRLTGRTRHAQTLLQAAARLGIAVTEAGPHFAPLGASLGGRVVLRRGLSQRELSATLAHELAHELLHQSTQGRRRPLTPALAETEAEATSWVVMKVLGLPSRAPTYIAWAGGSGTLIGASLARIQRASRTILRAALTPASSPP